MRQFVTYAAGAGQGSGLLERITTAWGDTGAPLVREGAMLAFVALCNDVGPPAEPFLLPLLPTLLGHYADKVHHPARPPAACIGLAALLCARASEWRPKTLKP